MQKIIHIEDYLKHEKYCWPLTMLSYPIILNNGVCEKRWDLRSTSGEHIPFQVSDIKKDGELVTGLTLHFMSGLKMGECKEYLFVAQENLITDTESGKLASCFDLSVDARNNCIIVSYGDKKMICRLPLELVEYHVVHSGIIFEEVEFVCKGKGEQKHTLKLRRIADMPFWELQEQMSGFAEDDECLEMQIIFENFNFTHRHSAFRPVEKIDAYLDKDNIMPITVMPYENYVSWNQSKYIAFLGDVCSAGVFIRDNMGWDDGKYPIWGSNREFGITFCCEEEKITARFPLRNGRRFVGLTAYEGGDTFYVQNLWKWYSLFHLNKVKEWVLNWDEEQSQYPRFFKKEQGKPILAHDWHYKRGEMLNGQKMKDVIDQLSCSVNGGIDVEDQGLDPVRNREFACWTVIMDLTADEMTKEEFERAKAMFAFMAYVTKDENYMPTINMLAGHPNFLADTASVSGFMAALFPHHPEKEKFLSYFNRIVSLNMEYHIRPDVEAYESLGGRETENLACYSFAMLRPFIHVCKLYELCGYPIPLVCDNGAKWLNWMTNCMSAPIAGRRTIPPQGAHARSVEIPYSLYEFAQLLENQYPEIAKNTYAVCEGCVLESFEYANKEDDIWYTLFNKNSERGNLTLKSEKFTGYGCILREAVGTEDEISVHVQQLDLGPNYRWGCFENTGNGGIHYYAAGRRYSFNAPEATGDENIGAEQGNCSFSVLKGHTYHNIGFQDLTEPLRVFPVIKEIKLMAGENIKDFYKYRRVSLVEKDYVVMYDAVTHMRARGRFLWTVNEAEDFPEIWQLQPGCKGRICGMQPVGSTLGIASTNQQNWQTKSVAYDGYGNFLTIISHRKDIQAQKANYGGIVYLNERTDYIFEDSAQIHVEENNLKFDGYSGIISVYVDGKIKGALIEGQKIGCSDLYIVLQGKGAVFFEKSDGDWNGIVVADEQCSMQINNREISLNKGKYRWKLGKEIIVDKLRDDIFSNINKFVRDTRKYEFGFAGTDFKENSTILIYPK